MKLIAETAWHHDGNLGFFKNLVKAIATKTKADYIKFHLTLDVDEYMHTDHPGYQWAKERVFSESEWREIFQITTENGKKLMLLFNDKAAINFGMRYKPELIEIHSVCLNDIKLLNHLKNNLEEETKIVLGIGGTDLYEVENAIKILENHNIVLMHGFQNYPTKYEDINFTKIRKLMSLFSKYENGYADHTAWDNDNNILITLLGAALGMNYIEKHVTIAPGKGRTDWQAAVSLENFNKIHEQLRILKAANGDGQLKLNNGEQTYSTFGVMKKAAVLNKDMQQGEQLQMEDIDFKRTAQNSDMSQLDVLNKIGGTYTKEVKKGHCIVKSDIT